MTLLSYIALDASGRRLRGCLNASHELDLELRLERMGLRLIHAKPLAGRLVVHPWRRAVSRRELITFCFHLEQLGKAGIPLVEGLCDLRDSASSLSFRFLIADLVDAVENGKELSQALALHGEIFDPVFINLVRAGEVSGRLPATLNKLGAMLRWQDELAAQTRKILAYPIFVALVVVAAVAFLMIYLVPQLMNFIRSLDQQLPLYTRALLALSGFLSSYGWLLLVLPPVFIAGTKAAAARNARLRWWLDDCKLKLWGLGPILRALILSRFTHFFALLYEAGIPVVQALKIAEGCVGNTVLAAAVARVHGSIIEGQCLAASFERAGIFPPLILRMVRVGENSGALDEALQTVGYFYERDLKEAIGRIQTLIEPVLTLVLGLLLAWVMLAVLGPVYNGISRIRP